MITGERAILHPPRPRRRHDPPAPRPKGHGGGGGHGRHRLRPAHRDSPARSPPALRSLVDRLQPLQPRSGNGARARIMQDPGSPRVMTVTMGPVMTMGPVRLRMPDACARRAPRHAAGPASPPVPAAGTPAPLTGGSAGNATGSSGPSAGSGRPKGSRRARARPPATFLRPCSALHGRSLLRALAKPLNGDAA